MTFTPQEARRLFTDFCVKVNALSGVTPHLIMVGESCARLSFPEIVWRGGLYAAGYNFSTAEVLWQHWPYPGKVLKSPPAFTAWVKQHWKGLPLRKERKAVNAPARLAECILSFAAWQNGPPLRALYGPGQSYDDAWANFQQVRFMGRYICIRFLEYLHQYAGLLPQMYDSRANGGKYPRQGLALLYPEHAGPLLGGDSFAECAASNKVACRELDRLKGAGVYLTHYQLQSLICEFKQAALSGHQYPAKALDSELVYHGKVGAYWGKPYLQATAFKAVRRGFAPEARGELNGWAGKRKPLDTVLRDYGYNWSDQDFDYLATQDFARPVRRGKAAGA
jgi:hypothetical protein